MSADQYSDDVELRVLRLSALRCVLWAAGFLFLQLAIWFTDRHNYLAVMVSSDLRLALLLDIAFSVTLINGAFRLFELLRAVEGRQVAPEIGPDATDARRKRRRQVGNRLVAVVALAALANLGKDVWLWVEFAPDKELKEWLTWLSPLLSGAALVPIAAAVVQLHRKNGTELLGDPMRQAVRSGSPPISKATTIIACSGGGIRSASFCLGALQAMMKDGIYRNASAVIGVSGGGYMAAAFHFVGRRLGKADPEQPDSNEPSPFEQGTPELALLRRKTRYLLPHPTELFRGLLSVVYGVLINIVMIAFALRAISWVLGWYLQRFDVLEVRSNLHGFDRRLLVDINPYWLGAALLPWAFAVFLFLAVEKVVEHFVQAPDDVRRSTRQLMGWMLGAGLASTVLMLGVPLTAKLLASIARGDQFVPEPLVLALNGGLWNVASIATVVTALIALGRTVWTGLHKTSEQSKLLGRLISQLRTVVAPWLGTAIILVVSFVVLTRWTVGYATEAGWRYNWGTAAVFGALALGARVFTDANRTSLHHFYRERLATAYLLKRKDSAADVEDYRKPMRVSRYAAPNGGGGPELVMAAVANVGDEQYVPTGRGCVPFIISASETGVVGDPHLPPNGMRDTAAYEDAADYRGGRDLTVPAAMAISGAAFSPLTGRANARTRPIRVLLTVLNARLGVWLPNPYLSSPPVIRGARADFQQYKQALTKARAAAKKTAEAAGLDQAAVQAAVEAATVSDPEVPSRWRVRRRDTVAYVFSLAGKPGPYRLLREAFGRPSLYDRKLYVTDGGHYDNLGLLEALRRRPKRIVVIDASTDGANRFGALADAVATARMDLGVEITIPTKDLRSDDGERARKAWAVGSADYGDSHPPTAIYLLKALLIDDLSTDIENYKVKNADFPNRSTGDQLYDEWDFEAYRYLGNSLATRMLADTDLKEVVTEEVEARTRAQQRKRSRRAARAAETVDRTQSVPRDGESVETAEPTESVETADTATVTQLRDRKSTQMSLVKSDGHSPQD